MFNDYYTIRKSDKKQKFNSLVSHKRNDYHHRHNFILNEKTILIAIIGILSVAIIIGLIMSSESIAAFMTNLYKNFISFWITNTKNKAIQSVFMGFVLFSLCICFYCIKESYIQNRGLKLTLAVLAIIITIMIISWFGLWNWLILAGFLLVIATIEFCQFICIIF